MNLNNLETPQKRSSSDESLSIEKLSENAKDKVIYHGVLRRTKDKANDYIPFTLFPSPIPKEGFNLVHTIQPYINRLIYLSSQDFQFVSTSLKSVVESDEFICNLFEIYKDTQSCHTKSVFEVGILRSDYMLDSPPNSNGEGIPKQIEINSISELAGVASSLTSVHSRILKEAKREEHRQLLPDNCSRNGAAQGLVAGWRAYDNKSSVIMFLVPETTSNIFDQRALEYEIYKINEDIPVRRKTLDDVISHIAVSDDSKLFVDNEEIAVVYFICGYDPAHFPTQKHWEARRTIERSRAIKCPSVGAQLMGTKTIQEVFARPGTVEKFVKDSEMAKKIRGTFTGLYSLEMNPSGDANMKMAMSDPDSYVMKPQREGSGKNLHGEKIVSVLTEIGSDKRRSAYTLMDKIRPKPSENYIIGMDHSVVKAEVVSELGVYGVYLAKGNEFIENYASGYLLRSKSNDQNDGGVLAGVAFMDTPMLI